MQKPCTDISTSQTQLRFHAGTVQQNPCTQVSTELRLRFLCILTKLNPTVGNSEDVAYTERRISRNVCRTLNLGGGDGEELISYL